MSEAGFAGNGGAGSASEPAMRGSAAWTEGLSADQIALVETKGWRGPADMLSSYQHAERHIGRDPDSLLAVPGAAAGEEEWRQVYDRLGRPEGPEGYAFEPIGGIDTEDDPALAALAHELGLNPDQASLLRDRHYEASTRGAQDGMAALRSGIRDAGTALRREWGHAYGERDRMAGRAAQMIGLDVATLARSGLLTGEHGVRLIRGLASLGEMLAEDKVLGGAGGFTQTAAQARDEIDQLKLDQGFLDAYLNREHVGHKAAVDRMYRLHRAAYR